jgi:aminopeptidase N
MRFRPLTRLALTLLAVAGAVAVRAEKPFSFADTPGQLPKVVIPRHYTLRIQPDLEARTTTGTARIDLEVTQPVRELVLNANELEITSAALAPTAPNALPRQLPPQLDEKKQTLTLPLPESLPAGKYTLVISYRGKIGTQAQGLFVDRYPTPSGDKLMLGTQFEPTDARRVFPCWDEPVYRATYDITLVVREKLMAVGNMPVTAEKNLGDGWKETTFARTPSMPTYLVALYAGEFETLEGEQDGVKLRIITTEGKRATATYALESTKRILAYFNTYFGVPYPLPKLDQIAVPNAFSTFSAMENWGLISYIDTAILFDPAASSQTRREAVFTTIAHEIAHQWFGNLVTMAWWDNLWLNEGFASWMGTKCSDALNPDWQLWLRANADKERAMELDARKTTHPVQRPIANESQASDAFDVISYQKGQSFLRMLEAYLGEDTFRDGIRRYIAKHKYSNTTTADLWTALGDASGKPVVALAANWTEQPGFPVILASASGSGANRTVKLEQVRFTLNDPNAAPLSWKIPVTFANTADLKQPGVVLLQSNTATIPWPAGSGTLKLNVGDTGYYRVRYDDPLADALAAQVKTLPVADQLNVLSDTWALVEAGRVPAPAWLTLAEQLGGSQSAPVVTTIVDNVALIDSLQIAQRGRRTFQAWMVQLLSPQLARVGWDPTAGESPLDGTLRADLVRTLGAAGDRAVIAEASRRFEAYRKDPKSLAGNLRTPVLTTVGRYASRETYDQLHALAKAAMTTEEKRRAYGAMQAAVDPALAQETLKLSLSGELSTNEATRNVERIARAEHAALAWDYAQANMDALLKQVTFFGRNAYVPNIMKAFTDAPRADELEAYVRKNLPEDAMAEAAKVSDRIRHLAAVKQRELPAIDAWVKTRVKSPE